MRLAIEAVGIKHSGGATVLLDFLDEVERDARIETVFLFCSERKLRLFSLAAYSKLHSVEKPAAESASGRLLWTNWGLSNAVKELQADALLCFNGVGQGPSHVPKASFIQQSLPFCQEALAACPVRDRLRCMVIRQTMRQCARTADAVFVQTRTMRSWVAEGLDIGAERIAVVVPSVREFADSGGPDAPPAMRAAPPDRRLLYVGNSSGYKNVACAIRGMNEVREKIPGAVLFVTWPADHPACQTEGIVGVGYLTGATLSAAYKAASAFVLPSLVESGNVTMMEAMSVSTPVLAADRPYAHDLCEDAALFFDPRDPAAFALAAIEMLTNERLQKSLAQKGRDLVQRRQCNRPYRLMIDHICELAERNQARAQGAAEFA